MRRSLSCFIVLSSAALVAAGPAFAQTTQTSRPERPYRGLFASGTDNASETLVGNVSLSGGYDDNLRAASGGGRIAAADEARKGMLGMFTGSLSYSRQSDAFTLSASAATGTRYYPGTLTDSVRSSQARVALTARPWSGTSVSGRVGAVRQPDTFANLFTSAAEAPVDDIPAAELDTLPAVDYYVAYDGGLTMQHKVGARTTLGALYGMRRTSGRGTRGEFVHQRGGALATHQLARGLSVRAGYTYAGVNYADGGHTPNHLIDAGVNYNRSLSFSRRTTLSFGTGTTATRTHDTLRYRLVGHARLNHEIGRTWNAFAAYSRRVLLHESWQEPVLANGLTAGFGGLISRRLEFTTTARAAFGSVGVDNTGGNRFDTYYGSAALSYALARYMNVGLTYAYYRHHADASVVLPPDYPRTFDRQSIRATVNLWAPLFQRARRTHASR